VDSEHKTCAFHSQLNNRLSFGQQWVWKQQTAKYSGAKRGHKVLDVCCGSGDLAFLLSRLVGPRGQVIVRAKPVYVNMRLHMTTVAFVAGCC
jgi:ubiquinone/menaquinone biosynthesis C-methylase UbiE